MSSDRFGGMGATPPSSSSPLGGATAVPVPAFVKKPAIIAVAVVLVLVVGYFALMRPTETRLEDSG